MEASIGDRCILYCKSVPKRETLALSKAWALLQFCATSLSKHHNVCTDDVTTLERSICVNKACVRALVHSIWNRVSYFWWMEERSCDGVWSRNRGSSLLLGKRGTERRGNGGAWTCSSSAAPLWLTAGLNMMSGTVRVKSATYRISGLTSSLLTHKSWVSALMPKRIMSLWWVLFFWGFFHGHVEVKGLGLITPQLKINDCDKSQKSS